MDKSTISTTTTHTLNDDYLNNNKFITIPIQGDLAKSLEYMTEDQINFNLLQLNLVSIYNDAILQKLYNFSKCTKFYLKNRYILEKLINGKTKVNNKKKSIKSIYEHYDTSYVNGRDLKNGDVSEIIEEGMTKEVRAKFISTREEFTSFLDQLSLDLKKEEKKLNIDDLHAFFETQLGKINGFQILSNVSPAKQKHFEEQLDHSEFSEQKQQIQLISSQSSIDSPKKYSQGQKRTIFTICFRNTVYDVKEIKIQNCRFINTKNRCPIVLDFNFSKFLFKNDNQVSHELISMHLIRYVNRIISKINLQQIVQYQILPEANGAFYQFVQNALTVHEIKGKFEKGIPQYLDYLEQLNLESSKIKISNIRKRFAETLAGFCLIQYLLDLKDRNNSNIMIKSDGSIFHIDLAFIFNSTPGDIGFESAPFKLTKQYIEAMGGFDSDCFKHFQALIISDLVKLAINREQYLTKINILSSRKEQILCFNKFRFEKYQSKIPKKPEQVKRLVEDLIADSYDNWRTNKYDEYQFKTNKILM